MFKTALAYVMNVFVLHFGSTVEIMVLPADNGRARSASPLCWKFRPFIEVIKYEHEDCISIIKTVFIY